MKRTGIQGCGLGVVYGLLASMGTDTNGVTLERFEFAMQSTPGISLPPGVDVSSLLEDMERYHMVQIEGTTLRVLPAGRAHVHPRHGVALASAR